MKAECHMHMVLDGRNWREAIARHRGACDEEYIRKTLRSYADAGYTYLRDGGDKWGVGARARQMADAFGITYRTPLAPLCKRGHYGAFIGRSYENLTEYAHFVQEMRKNGADFVKIMISGLMDFDHSGVLTEEGLPAREIREIVHIAREEGFSVMAHANGARTVEAAAEAGVGSVEHGAYLDDEAMAAMHENAVVWVPTLSAVGNLRGTGRFCEKAVAEILDGAMENVRRFSDMGGLIAEGSDAGAWAVAHAGQTEFALLASALGENEQDVITRGNRAIAQRF